MANTPKKLGQQTYSKEQVIVDPAGIEFEIEGQGGVYLIVVTGNKADVSAISSVM